MGDNSAPFLGGFFMGGWSGLSFWDDALSLLQIDTMQFLEYFALKLAATMVLGLFGGIMGMLAKDIYRLVKSKIFKK